jgi:anti-sigma-K factor RskA
MDSNKIIEDGLLEQYLLGELGEDLQLEIEEALQKDESLRVLYKDMEQDFERIAFENAISPPPGVRKSLKDHLESEPGENGLHMLNSDKKASSVQKGRLLVAASLAAIFALSSFWLYDRWQTAEENLQLVKDQTSDLQNRLVTLEKNIQESNSRFRKINNANVIPFLLEGNEISPKSKAVAYVNHTTKEIIVSPQALTPLDEYHTYQMWADVDGEMVNMGLVPIDDELIALEYIEGAESLNITIEPANGSEHPTVERLISSVTI